jgi:hypothetical protein
VRVGLVQSNTFLYYIPIPISKPKGSSESRKFTKCAQISTRASSQGVQNAEKDEEGRKLSFGGSHSKKCFLSYFALFALYLLMLGQFRMSITFFLIFYALRKLFKRAFQWHPTRPPQIQTRVPKGIPKGHGTHRSKNSTKSHKITWKKFFHSWSDHQKPIETRKTGPLPVSERPIPAFCIVLQCLSCSCNLTIDLDHSFVTRTLVDITRGTSYVD